MQLANPMRPFAEIPAEQARGLRYVLHDIDDTITDEGKLLPQAYEALWRLHEAGIRVVPVTGRPAGWCDMIIRQWPVDAVVGENGAFACYLDAQGQPQVLTHPSVAAPEARVGLEAVREACLRGVHGCRVARDQFSRRYDLAIDFCEDPPLLTLDDAQRIRDIAVGMGAQAKISSIHVNIWFGAYDKLAMVQLLFGQVWQAKDLFDSGIFFGDSPNDEPMFAAFPVSCAVANIRPFVPSLRHLPTYVTEQRGGIGFAAAVDHLLRLRAFQSE